MRHQHLQYVWKHKRHLCQIHPNTIIWAIYLKGNRKNTKFTKRIKAILYFNVNVLFFHCGLIHCSFPAWVSNKIWYMAKAHYPVGFAVAVPWTNPPLGIISGAVIATPPLTTLWLLWSYRILSDTHMKKLHSQESEGIWWNETTTLCQTRIRTIT